MISIGKYHFARRSVKIRKVPILPNSVTEYAHHRFADHIWLRVIVNGVLGIRQLLIILRKKNTQNEDIIAHLEYFFTCHYSKNVWIAENLNEIKITYCEKIFSHTKQTFSHFEKGLRIKNIFCLTEIAIIFTEIHYVKTKPKSNFQNI